MMMTIINLMNMMKMTIETPATTFFYRCISLIKAVYVIIIGCKFMTTNHMQMTETYNDNTDGDDNKNMNDIF